MYKYLLFNLFFLNRKKLIIEKQILYKKIVSNEDKYNFQLNRFNKMWSIVSKENEFYKFWKKKYNLPSKIYSLNEILDFPVLTKKVIKENKDLIFSNLKSFNTISTGGSTGVPTVFPVSSEEKNIYYANTYLGRSWWGVSPLDKITLIWGHSHLFGSGWIGRFNKIKRILFDWIINTKRLNAYNLSTSSLKEYFNIITKTNPECIIGYSSAIYKILKYVKDQKLKYSDKFSRIKAVILTSETVNDVDVGLINDVLKSNAVIEYGMAETGVLAYSKKDTYNINIFWDSFIFQEINSSLNITTLDNKLFPLINYQTDDLVDVSNKYNSSVFSLEKIIGRSHDYIQLLVGSKYVQTHGEIFTHILKSVDGIYSFRIIQKKNLTIIVKYESKIEISIKNFFLNEIKKEFKEISENQFVFKRVDKLLSTISGKSKWILTE